MEVEIRFAEEKDYPQVEKIMNQVQGLHIQWRPDIYKNVEILLPFDMYMGHVKKRELIVAAKKDGDVVGIVIYITRNISGGPRVDRKIMFIDSMGVDEEYRGQGIGHQLFAFVRNICTEQGYDGLELQVNAKNTAAKRMYEKYGFTEKSINMELL